MEDKLSSVAKTFTPSPIQELSHLAQRCNAINLAEGFPDFPAPSHLKTAAVSAINSDFNQYRFASTSPFLLLHLHKNTWTTLIRYPNTISGVLLFQNVMQSLKSN